MISNGGFESGTLAGWTVANDGPGGFAINDGSLDPEGPEVPTPPLLGRFSATTAPQPPGGSYALSQTVTIPAAATTATLRWSDRVRNFEPTGIFSNDPLFPHAFRVEVRDVNDQLQEVLFTTEPGDEPLTDWKKRQADLSSYRGQTLKLIFLNQVSLFYFSVHLDKISLVVTMPGSVNTEIYLGTNATLNSGQLIGQTTNTRWRVDGLLSATTYYWRLVSRWDNASYAGPVWSFRTAPRGPLDHFTFAPVASPQVSGQLMVVRASARDRFENLLTDYAGEAQLSGAILPDVPESPPSFFNAPDYSAYTMVDHGTVGYAFTPVRDLWVTGFKPFFGDAIGLWTDSGLLLTRQSLAPHDGVWRSLNLPQPIPLRAGRTYRIGVHASPAGLCYARFDLTNAFADGLIGQGYVTEGDAMPAVPHPARWWLADLVYSTQPLQALPGLVSRSVTFTNGIWAGSLVVSSAADRALLRLQAGSGIVGLTNPFDVSAEEDGDGDGVPDRWETLYGFDPRDPDDANQDADGDGVSNLDEYRGGTDPRSAESVFRLVTMRRQAQSIQLEFNSETGRTYRLERTTTLTGGGWMPIGESVAGTGGLLQVTDSQPADGGTAFYRVALVE